VTGGSGFLGSHLCERLLAEGAEVICLDNCFTGARRNIDPIYLEIDQIYNLARMDTLDALAELAEAEYRVPEINARIDAQRSRL
jgi:nucleoside-diphosphate-sugar epimerase